MSYSRLVIGGDYIEAVTNSEIPVTIDISIADVRDPAKRNSAFSKTIELIGTHETNLLFEMIWQVNARLSTFNPNLKMSCEYWVGNDRVFTGDIQLLKVRCKGLYPTPYIIYEVSIVGHLANLFLDLGNDLLTDLDFSDLDHAFSYANRNWTPTLGTGYVYPFIDYGVSGGIDGGTNINYWTFKHLKPAIFAKEYVDRIFAAQSKTYTSAFFTSTYFKSLIIPDVNEGALKMTAADIADKKFYAGKTGATTFTLNGAYSPVLGGWTFGTVNTVIGTLIYDDDSTNPFYDNGSDYNTGTSTWVTAITHWYNVISNNQFEIQINGPVGSATRTIVNGTYGFRVEFVASGGPFAQSSISTSAPLGSFQDFNGFANLPNGILGAGENVTVRLVIDSSNLLLTKFFTGGGGDITTGTASITIRQKDTSTYAAQLAQYELALGSTVVMNDTIPRDIKQVDFLTSIIKMFNLYIELDPSDSTNYIIEPRETFLLNTSPKNWTTKYDYMNDREIIPMGETEAREYIFSYKTDGDKYNKLYEADYKEVYGAEKILVLNDFVRSSKKNEVIFSSTPIAACFSNDIVAPVLAAADGANIKPMKCNIRILYWGGLIDCAPYVFQQLSSLSIPTSYPFCGHVDNPNAPTIDLCFDNPKKLYWYLPGQTYTDNNLYNAYYSKFITEITDQNSKIVRARFNLQPSDIANFSFRYAVFVDDCYYWVNKIIDYNPQERRTTLVELLKIKAGETFVSQIVVIGEGVYEGVVTEGGIFDPNGNYSNVQGSENINLGENSGIDGGSGNYIGGLINYG